MPAIKLVSEVPDEAKLVKAVVVGEPTGSVTFKANEAQVITAKKARIRELEQQIGNWQNKIKEKKEEIKRVNKQIKLLEQSLELSN